MTCMQEASFFWGQRIINPCFKHGSLGGNTVKTRWWCGQVVGSDSQDGDVGADPDIISNGNWLADAHSGLSSVQAERV